jgi:hypothetical protein
MVDDPFVKTKKSVLGHVEKLFAEIEQEMAISHQEKYALLEDAFENASDVDELRVAFDQWFSDHSEDLGFEEELDELWDQAVAEDEEDTLDVDEGVFEDEEEEDDELGDEIVE